MESFTEFKVDLKDEDVVNVKDEPIDGQVPASHLPFSHAGLDSISGAEAGNHLLLASTDEPLKVEVKEEPLDGQPCASPPAFTSRHTTATGSLSSRTEYCWVSDGLRVPTSDTTVPAPAASHHATTGPAPTTDNTATSHMKQNGIEPDITWKLLNKNKLDYTIRSQKVRPTGYEVGHDGGVRYGLPASESLPGDVPPEEGAPEASASLADVPQDGAVVAPTPVVTVPSAEGATGLQLARANSTKAKAGHRAALLEEIREQNNSFRELVSSALAPTSGPREPQLQYWDDYFSHLKYECLSIAGNLRSDFTMEMTALVNRWKKLAGTGAEEAGSAHMLHMIAAVDDRKKAVPQEVARAPQTMHTVPSGAMPLVPGTNPLQPASASTVFRAIPQQVAPQQHQVVAQPQQVLHRPPTSFTPYEPNTSLQSLGSFMVDHLPPNFSFSSPAHTTISTPVHTPSSAQGSLNTPQK